MSTSDIKIKCFNAIISFIGDLDSGFGDLSRPLHLYYAILQQVTFTHQTAIDKNIELFGVFTHQNQEGILSRDFNLFAQTTISYSDKAYVDLRYIFSISNQEQQEVIWQHLLTILALINPESRARAILESLHHSETEEAHLINSMVSKLEQHVDLNDAANPMDAVTKILQSGAFTEMVQELSEGMQNGNLDIQKLMSSIGGPMATIKE